MYNSLILGRHEIKFGGRDSRRDLGLILTDADIGSVQLKTVDVNIPYTNYPLTYDFSQICGEPIYLPRKLRFTFALNSPAPRLWQDKYRDVCEWLIQQPRGELYFDVIRGYHFTARCDKVGVTNMYNDHVGEITAEFTADPYMLSEDYGDIPWDIFSFDNDCINKTRILATSIGGEIDIYSFAERDIVPALRARFLTDTAAQLNVRLNGEFLTPITRDNNGRKIRRRDFIIKPGRNKLLIRGQGQLDVELIEEVL